MLELISTKKEKQMQKRKKNCFISLSIYLFVVKRVERLQKPTQQLYSREFEGPVLKLLMILS